MKINTVVKCGVEYDAEIVADKCINLYTNFYTLNGFYPVNYFIPDNLSIVLPDFPAKNYKKIEKIISSIEHLAENNPLPDQVSPLNKYIKSVLPKYHNAVDPVLINNIKTNWDYISERFADYLENIFISKIETLDLEVIVSNYGLSSIFSQINLHRKHVQFGICIRSDMGIEDIAKLVIRGIFNSNAYKDYNWSEKIAMGDMILKSTKFSNLFPNFKGTVEKLRNFNKDTKLLVESRKFLDSIGYSDKESIKFVKNMIYINGIIPEYCFTPVETRILKLLLDHKKRLCSYFDIANIIWENPDDFSMWTISTMIYRIRNKLNKNGISHVNLKTYRGKGFILDI